jgi:2-methylisocitrate lyase-like PEP mutase family enzyme
MSDAVEKAERFRALHRGPPPLVLPNAWDVPSARLFEDAGFPAVATTSAALMASLGYPDGERMPRRELLSAIRRIATRLAIPLSVDLVAGYGRGPRAVAKTVEQAVRAGAVGVNVEDVEPARRTLAPVRAQVAKVKAIRAAAEAIGVPLVLNARTDAFRFGEGDDAARLRETIDRLAAYRDAGADCVYPMGLADGESIGAVVRALDCPVNVMVRAGLPSVPELERLGVKRVSFGPYGAYAALGLLKLASAEVRERGTYTRLLEGAITHDELNALAVPRRRSSREGS